MAVQQMPTEGLTAAEIVKQYLAIRTFIEKQEAELKEKLKPYREGLEALESAADKLLRATGQSALQCKGIGTAFYTTWTSITCSDRVAFHDFVISTNARQLLTAHVSKEAVLQYMEEHEGTLPPGIARETGIKVQFRKG